LPSKPTETCQNVSKNENELIMSDPIDIPRKNSEEDNFSIYSKILTDKELLFTKLLKEINLLIHRYKKEFNPIAKSSFFYKKSNKLKPVNIEYIDY